MRFKLYMLLSLLVGLAYVAWLAWAEGWRLWVVLGVMVLVALIGGVVHVAMGMARAHDGLERGLEGEDRTGDGSRTGREREEP